MSTAVVEAPELVYVEITDTSNVVGMVMPDLSVVEVLTTPAPTRVATVTIPTAVVVEIDDPVALAVLVPDPQLIELTVTQDAPIEIVHQTQYAEVVDTIMRGDPGPMGPAGITKITHGSDPNYPRPPDVPLVYWVGSVQPVNADPDDLLMLK